MSVYKRLPFLISRYSLTRLFSIQHLDPTIVTKRRNAFFSLVRVFTWEFSVLSVLVLLQSVLDFATPVGVKNLLGCVRSVILSLFRLHC